MSTPDATLESVAARTWDVAVIGAGPAGSAAAYACANRGLRTLIVEKARFPREKVCGACLSPAGVASLRRMGIEDRVRARGESLKAFALCAGRQRMRMELDGSGLAIGRAEFDGILLDHAEQSGAVALCGSAALSVEGAHSCVRFSLSAGGAFAMLAVPVVIVADGLAGTFLPKVAEWQAGVVRGSLFGVGARLPGQLRWKELETGTIHMHCGNAGYFGAVILGDGSIDVAAALAPDATRRAGGPGETVGAIAESAGLSCAEALAEAPWRGTALLTRRRRVESGRILVAGDAGGYVEPFTGEGMSWALATGLAVADHAAALINGTSVPGAWADRWNRLVGERRAMCRVTALALRHPRLTRAAIAASNALPLLAEFGAKVIGGPWVRANPKAVPA